MTTTTHPLMTTATAAWIRENAWTPEMRASYAGLPAVWNSCACQWQCRSCKEGTPSRCYGPTTEVPYSYVMQPGGLLPALLDGRPARPAELWLASHTCGWHCYLTAARA